MDVSTGHAFCACATPQKMSSPKRAAKKDVIDRMVPLASGFRSERAFLGRFEYQLRLPTSHIERMARLDPVFRPSSSSATHCAQARRTPPRTLDSTQRFTPTERIDAREHVPCPRTCFDRILSPSYCCFVTTACRVISFEPRTPSAQRSLAEWSDNLSVFCVELSSSHGRGYRRTPARRLPRGMADESARACIFANGTTGTCKAVRNVELNFANIICNTYPII